MNIDLILAQASSAILVSWWQALLIAIPFLGWGYLVPKLEKDARYYHFNVKMWNSLQLAAGVAALAAMLLIPLFWISWPVGMILLLAPVLSYWHFRNNAVPEHEKFTLSSEGLSKKLEMRRQARASRDVVLQFVDANERRRPAPTKEDPLHAVQMLAEDLLTPALAARSSHIKLSVSPKGCSVSQYVDGVRYDRSACEVEPAIRLVDFFKDLAGLDVEDRRRPQTGEFTLIAPDGQTDVHIATTGSSSGQAMRIDFDRASRRNKPFDGLGLLPSQIQPLKELAEVENRHGVVLLGAPTGHGLTTTAYAMLNRHDAYTSNIKSIEREVEVLLDGVDQQKFDASNPNVDFATALQSILRRDPDVVMISESTDAETAKVIVEPGMNGPLLYVPQRVPTIAEHIRLWVKMVGDVKAAMKPLRAVTNQRLLRTVCPHCRQGYQPTPEQLKKLNIPQGKVRELYHANGKVQVKNKIEACPVCGGTGYLGQTAAFEVLIVDDALRKTLIDGDLKAAMAQARRNKMMYLQEAALSKVVAGETTVEEVIRVTAPSAGAKKSAQSKAKKAAEPTSPGA